MQALTLALLLAASPGCEMLNAPHVEQLPGTRHVVRVSRAVVELVEPSTGVVLGVAAVGPGRWYSVTGGERLEQEWARLQVERAEAETRARTAESRPLVPGGGVSHQALAVVALVAMSLGVLVGGVLRRLER